MGAISRALTLACVEWAGESEQKAVVDWTSLAGGTTQRISPRSSKASLSNNRTLMNVTAPRATAFS